MISAEPATGSDLGQAEGALGSVHARNSLSLVHVAWNTAFNSGDPTLFFGRTGPKADVLDITVELGYGSAESRNPLNIGFSISIRLREIELSARTKWLLRPGRLRNPPEPEN